MNANVWPKSNGGVAGIVDVLVASVIIEFLCALCDLETIVETPCWGVWQ
jgi:hypothetical protein